MIKTLNTSPRAKAKQTAVFDAAADVFAQYGFKRTTMNDIAVATGISRPALYLMFDNKEHLFRELAAYRLNLALKAAKVFKGNPSLSIIKEVFEETFNTKIHNIYKTRGEIKATEHPADFLEDLVYWFNKSLEDEDDMDS